MRKINEKAWSILKDEERTALNLQYGMSKSSWQSGEIMARSHYKYLEIKYRAERFLRIFTEHFELYDVVIPEYINCDEVVFYYLTRCLRMRMKPMDALVEWNKTHKRKIEKSELNEKVEAQINKWKESESPDEKVVLELVKEFDRWNNFRILPRNCQEPSAFKRRVKNVYKRRVRLTTALPDLSIRKIKKIFLAKRKPCLYLPIINKKRLIIIPILTNKKTLEVFKELQLYIFKDQEEAADYAKLIFKYVSKTDRECKDGLEFWPTYRESIKRAVNYEAIDNIIPSRRHLLMALSKHEFL